MWWGARVTRECVAMSVRREDGEHVQLPAVVERNQQREPRAGLRGRLRGPGLGRPDSLVLCHPRDVRGAPAAAPREGLGRLPR